jgi:4'-phosphopantetheinyl transferase
MIIYELFLNEYEWTSQDDYLIQFVSSERRERMKRYRLVEDKKNCLYSELMLRYHLLHKADINEKSIIIQQTKEGKPYIYNYPLHFNITHTKGGVLCVVSKDMVGIDIERVFSAPTNIMRMCFSKEEINEVNKLQGEESDKLFYYIWTRKEAYCKWNGLGITQDLKNIITLHNSENKLFDTWYQKGYCISTCSMDHEKHKIELSEESILKFYSERSFSKFSDT